MGVFGKKPGKRSYSAKTCKKSPRILSVDQIKKVFDTVKHHRYYPIYLIAVGCGLREGEILGLERRDVNLEEGILQVRQTVISIRGKLSIGEPKTDKAKRAVAIPGFVADVLKDHLKKDGLLFTTSSGKPVSPRNLLRHFHLSLARAGIPRVKFHSLRHSYATIQLISGTNPKIVQEALGHSTITLTLDTYSHIIPTLQKEAAENINRVFKA
jgi:integrase